MTSVSYWFSCPTKKPDFLMKDALSTKSRIGSPNVCIGRVVFNNIKDFKADSDTYD